MTTHTSSNLVRLHERRRAIAVAPAPDHPARPSLLAGLARRAVLSRLSGLSQGELTLLEGGEKHVFGRPGDPLKATVVIRHPWAFGAIGFGGTIGAAESYAEGLWDADDLTAVIRILLLAGDAADALEGGLARIGIAFERLRHRTRKNTVAGARANIAAHYDLGNDFFSIILDRTMTYSCAVFERPEMTLEEAQLAKIDRICRKLDLRPGLQLLEVGTGWGALALHAARKYGVTVTTTTLSKEQAEAARSRVRAEGLESKVRVLLADYRELTGRYDRVVSVEMIEAVGWEYYEDYFRTLQDRLHPDGLALVQAITIPDNRFEASKDEPNHINRIVFPGACVPSTTALLQAAAKASDLRLFHLEEIGPHYATTLRLWRERMLARWDDCKAAGKDERFLRMFEYYLASSEAGYAERHLGNVQLLFARPRSRREPILPDLAA